MRYHSYGRNWKPGWGIAAVLMSLAIGRGVIAIDIRANGDGLNSIVLADLGLVHSTDNIIVNQQRIDVGDSSVVLVLWNERTADGSLVPYYAISLDGQSVDRVRSASFDLLLRYQTYDPLSGAALVPAELAASESNVYIVQFETQPLILQRYSFGQRHRTKSLNLNPRPCNCRIVRLR